MYSRFLILVIACLFFFPLSSSAEYAPSYTWSTIETPHFLIHYHDGLDVAAYEVAEQAEEIQLEVSAYFNWTPKAKTHVVLSDQSETPNGSASVFPNNRIKLLMTPPSDISGLEDYQNWKRLVLKHEYAHIVHLDKAGDFPLDARSFIGRHWLFFPNTFLPRWTTEGIATFVETENDKKIGRGQSNFFRGMMRNEVIHGIKSLNQINQYRTEWPAGAGFYLYGVYFFNFIRDTYGEDKIALFVEEYSYFPLPYFINTVSKKTFGKDMFALWDEFEIYLNKEFTPEIESHRQKLAKNNLNRTKSITSSGYYSGYSRINNKLYYINSDRENIKQLIEQDTLSKKTRVITELKNHDGTFPHSFDVNADKGILIPLMNLYENYRQSFDLYQIDPKTSKRTQLTHNKRYIHAIWSADGNTILALGNHNGLHNLDLLEANGKLIKTIWQGKPGFAINAFDWSPVENKLVVSLFTPGNGWNLQLFNMDNSEWTALTSNTAIEAYPHFSSDGSHIIFSADYNGIYNAYQLDINTGETTQLTNSASVALFPTFDEKNKLIYFTELDKNGFNLKQAKPLSNIISREFIKGRNDYFSHTPLKSNKPVISEEQPYNSIKYLSPPWWIPIYISDPNQSSLGFISNSSDPLNFHNYHMILLFDSKNLEFNWNINYTNKKYATYFLINSRRESFNSKALQQTETESTIALIYPYIKQNYDFTLYSSFQHIGIEQSYLTSQRIDSFSNSHSTIGLSFDSTNHNSRSVAPHDGIKSSVSYELNKVQTSIKQHSRITFDAAVFSPHFYRAVFEARGILIGAGGEVNRTYLGGVQGNNIEPTPYGKNNYELKGYLLNQFNGTNLQKISLQMHYPLFYPETGLVRPPIGLGRININAIVESARVGDYSNINSHDWLSSIALEINLKTNFGYGRWPFNITAGLAKGLDEFGDNLTYTKISLNY